MAATGGASMAENQGKRRLKTGDEDRLSALPDFLIYHILSLLPATDLVKTTALSKWWKNQWTLVPVLNFVPNDGTSVDKFSNFIKTTLILHNCSKIDKFVINLKFLSVESLYPRPQYPKLDLWIFYAVLKDVKELIVEFSESLIHHPIDQFLFNKSSLVKLKLSYCELMPTGKVNWGLLKSLSLHFCELGNEAIENVLSGSPLLEYLELDELHLYEGVQGDVIASKSLKTLILDGFVSEGRAIEISCPNLERLRISGLVWLTSLKLMNLPSSVYATLDFYFDGKVEQLQDKMISYDDYINSVLKTLWQVQHVEKLEIGRWLMEILSSSKEDRDGIGGLPDSFILRIISFFPSTKDAFVTDQYKQCRWHKWNGVLNFISNEKLVINSNDIPLVDMDPRLSLWIRLAARKAVKELILDCDCANVEHKYPLPQFLFNNSSLVKMEICASDFMPNGNVNWESLKSLRLSSSSLGSQAIENVLSGSPLLEFIELHGCGFQGSVVVASEHLKTLILEEFGKNCHLLEISCPNLENFKIVGNVGSTRLKLTNLPSSLHATLDLYILESDDISPDDYMNLVETTRKQILHVEVLKFGLRRLRS